MEKPKLNRTIGIISAAVLAIALIAVSSSEPASGSLVVQDNGIGWVTDPINVWAENFYENGTFGISTWNIRDNTVDNADITHCFIQSGWVDDTTENTTILTPENQGPQINIEFKPSFTSMPVITVSDNDDNIDIIIENVSEAGFSIQLRWKFAGANVDAVAVPYDLNDNIRWIAMVAKQG